MYRVDSFAMSTSSRDHDLSTALCLAARHGDSVRLRELISLGANVMTAHETDGTTPLIAAVISGENEAVNVLISEKGKGQVKLADNVSFLYCAIPVYLIHLNVHLTPFPPPSPLTISSEKLQPIMRVLSDAVRLLQYYFIMVLIQHIVINQVVHLLMLLVNPYLLIVL